MKKTLLQKTILLVAVLFSSSLFAQDWVKMMQDHNVNFYEVQKAFNQYYAKKERQIEKENKKLRKAQGAALNEEEIEVPGTTQYKRWEWFMAPRVSPTGERFAPDAVWNAMEEYKKNYGTFAAGAWTLLGPTANTTFGQGAGRINAIRIHPTDPNTLFACAPSGGLWKSTNGGTSWTTNTDLLPQVIGCSDIAIDPTNTNTMYLATGDIDHGDTYSVGLLKSIDGGATWNKTGLSFGLSTFKLISRIIIDPANSNNLIVSTTSGIYRSTNAGTSFALVQAGSFMDMEIKPAAPATMYACGTEFYRSTNSGATWTLITAGLPAATALQRMAICVTAADANIVYLVAMKATTYDMEGFYKSTNGGTSFTKPSAPAIGNQGFYDLCLAANPTNAQEVLLGGQTQFMKSTNGGTSWAASGGSTHVDYHDIVYTSGTTVYLSSDGGVWKSTNNGGAWTNLSNALQISQMYGFGHSATNAGLTLQGWQDNGTNRSNGTTWSTVLGGDGMRAFISWGNDQNMWAEQYNGNLYRSINGGGSFANCITGLPGTGQAWDTEWNEDPNTANTIYAGFAHVWKSTNGGTNWAQIGTLGTATVTVQSIAVSKGSPTSQIIWAAKGNELYKTTNGGSGAWTKITSAPVGYISDIVCHPTDPLKAWICYSGYAAANKVLMTTNGGTSWTNLSASLPNIPMNCMAIDKNGNDAVYVGTDAGVFFKDASLTVWQPFSSGLPNVVIAQMEMFYGTPTKLRACSFGRGIWETTLYAPGTYAPDANFAGNKLIGCPGLGVQFTDYSAGSPTSWSWTFQGGNPATSTLQNPFVAYNTPGTYSVSLTATNGIGSDTQTLLSYITISASPNAAPTASGKQVCGPNAPVSLTATPSAPGTVRWWSQPAGGTLLGTGNTYTTTVTGNTTFYVDEAFPAGSVDIVGEVDNTGGTGGMFTANDIRGLLFDVTQPVVINSVQVYSGSAGMRTVEIIDANGNWVTDTTLNVPASPTALTTITINRTVYPGTNYMLKFRGTVDCYRQNAGATSYPYTSSAVNITGNTAGPAFYYFFYNWTYTKIVCNTGRTPVVVNDTCSVLGINNLFTNNSLNVFPNPSNGQFTVGFQVEKNDNYTVKITNAIGQSVYEEKLNDFSGAYNNKLDISAYGKGVYMLSVSNSKNETVKKVLVY